MISRGRFVRGNAVAIPAGGSPTEGTAFIKEKFGLDITPPQFSTCKSIAKKNGLRVGDTLDV